MCEGIRGILLVGDGEWGGCDLRIWGVDVCGEGCICMRVVLHVVLGWRE